MEDRVKLNLEDEAIETLQEGEKSEPVLESNNTILVEDHQTQHDKIEVATSTEKTEEPEKEVIDFSGKDFEKTQELLNIRARIEGMNKGISALKSNKHALTESTFAPLKTVTISQNDQPNAINTSDDVIQYHLDQFETIEELQKFLAGSVEVPEVAKKIESFFTHPTTGEVLEINSTSAAKTKKDELEFKRSLLIYFKDNDIYMKKIDEEIKKLDEATAEFNSNVRDVLNPLKDNLYAYANYLFEHSEPAEDDTSEMKKKKRLDREKAIAVRSAFTLENMFQLIREHPNIINNAKADFESQDKIRTIGQRYMNKLKSAEVNFNLAMYLGDDPHKSLEYLTLPKGSYKEELAGFTVFFLIRSLAVSLPERSSKLFHAAAQIVLGQFIEGKLDPDIAAIVKENIIKFLKMFE